MNGDGYADVVVGDPLRPGSVPGAGRVSVHHGSWFGPHPAADWVANGGQRGEHLGHAVVALGDLNGDGFDDLIVSAPDHDRELPVPDPAKHALVGSPPTPWDRDHGRVAVYAGSAAGLSSLPVWKQSGVEPEEHFGIALAAGDLNGDGFDDLVIGAAGTSGGRGAVFVFHGSASGPDMFPDLILLAPTQETGMGTSVAADGDANGDGFDDLLVGQPKVLGGKAWIYLGSAQGVDAQGAEISQAVNYVRTSFGETLAWAGDVDADGLDDVLVGDPNFFASGGHGGGGLAKAGAVYLALGTATGSQPAVLFAFGDTAGGRAGAALAGAGDLDNDGRDDFGYSAPGLTAGGIVRGRVEWLRKPDASNPDTMSEIQSPDTGTLFGRSLAGKRDVNGDGYPDVVIGEPYALDPDTSGRVLVYLGGPPSGIWNFPYVLKD